MAYVKTEGEDATPKRTSVLESDSPKEVGSRLATIRGAERQRDFADELGVHLTTWGRYERGERLPDAEVLQTLARRGYRLEWILCGTGEMRSDETSTALNNEALQAAIRTMLEIETEYGYLFDGAKRAQVAALIYEYLISPDEDEEAQDLGRFKRTVAKTLRLVT